MRLKDRAKKNPSLSQKPANKTIEDSYREFLQSFLKWMQLQNPSFSLYLSDEEIANYLFEGIVIPQYIESFISRHPLDTLSKTHQYISRYKDKTSMFAITMDIVPVREGNYRKVNL